MYAVILAGGGGTRLWPLSRSARPKPFLPLLRGVTLLQATVARLGPLIEPADVFVVTDQRYADLVREQLPEIPDRNLLLEPLGRNTAAAVAYAAVAIERPGDEVMLVVPADHAVNDEQRFRAALRAAAQRAQAGDLVTLGIRPTGPATGYGYVLAQGEPGRMDGFDAWQVERFVEKPTVERATELLAGGRASWNAGIFIWRRDSLLGGLERHAPDVLEPLRSACAEGADALAAGYPTLRATSIDYALLEPASLTGAVAVLPIDVGWSDLGSWAALLDQAMADDRAGEGGPDSDAVLFADDRSEVRTVASRDVLVHAAGGRLVALVGLMDAIVVDTPDAVLVCARDAAQDVRTIVDQLLAEGRRDQL